MHICHVNLASGYSGGENQTLLLIKEQLKQGYRLAVVANPKSPFYQACSELDLQLLPCSQFLRQHPRTLTKEYPLVHVHEGKAVYWAWLQKCLHGAPYIITRRVDNPLKKKVLLRKAYEHACGVVALSTAIQQAILSRLPGLDVSIIPSSPVTYPTSEALPKEISQSGQDPEFRVIQAGKFYAHKGHETTIGAARILAEEQPDIHIYLLGDGPDLDRIRSLSAGLRNVSFVGQQRNMGAWFEAANLLIHPSNSEGLGSVILEAMAAGLPTIGARAGGIPDIISDQHNGLLIEPGDSRGLAEAITKMKEDVQFRDQVLANTQETLDSFSIQRCAQRYESLYRSILD